MTNIGSFILILVCVGIGYVLEPIFFSDSNQSPLVSAPAEDGSAAKGTGDEASAPNTDPAPAPIPVPAPRDDGMKVDLSKISAADFPEKVILKLPYTLEDKESGVTMQLKAGAKVKPLRLEGDLLVFQLGRFPIEGKTEVVNTDFKELAVPIMVKRLQDALAQTDSGASAMDNQPAPTPEPAPEPAPKPVPEPTPQPVAKPTPEPDVAPAPNENGGTVDKAGIVALMQTSVKAGKVTEFEFKQVVSWNVGGDMEFDGKTYQVGRVTFKAETILGMQEHDAIALIENGAVVKWMWATTKLEMR